MLGYFNNITTISALNLDPREIYAFSEAKKRGIHRTVHAGEMGPAEAVKQVMKQPKVQHI